MNYCNYKKTALALAILTLHAPVHAEINELLIDNGAAYTSRTTRALLATLGIEDCKTAVCSPQSNGMAENFVKTLKRDYLPFIDLSHAEPALACLPEVIERYNNEHPHSALGYLSPAEFRAQNGQIQTESDPKQNSYFLFDA